MQQPRGHRTTVPFRQGIRPHASPGTAQDNPDDNQTAGSNGKDGQDRLLKRQKLPNFTVTVNGTSQSCSSGFDTSRPYRKGEEDCSFDVPAGQCRISVHASGYITQSFQHTCDRDETMMTTLSKAP